MLALVLLACDRTDTTDTDTGSPTSECPTAIAMEPPDAATDVRVDTIVSVAFSEASPGASIEVSTAGTPVPGSTGWTGATLEWRADAPLQTDTRYDVTLRSCTGTVTAGFTTGPVGPAVGLAQLLGRTWALDLGEATAAPGIATLLGSGGGPYVLLGATAGGPPQLRLAAGTEALAQDRCVPTTDLTLDLTDDPWVVLGPVNGAIPLSIGSLDTQQLVLTGGFLADASALHGAALSGEVVLDDDACEALTSFGLACTPCPSGSERCAHMELHGLTGVEVPVLVEPRTAADIAADAACP